MNETDNHRAVSLKLFVIPALLWGYIISSILAVTFWGRVYQKIIVTLDLSTNQGWALNVFWNTLLAGIGLLQCVWYLNTLRKRQPLSRSHHIACLLCVASVCLCAKVAVMEGFSKHRQVAATVEDSIGNAQDKVFGAAQVVDGRYSNYLVGICVKMPTGWDLGSLNLIERGKYSGAQAAFGRNTRRAEEMSARRPGVYPLLVSHKYAADYGGYNPSLFVSAYAKQAVSASGAGTTLEAYANSFTNVRDPYHALSKPVKERVGGATGFRIHIEGRFSTATIQQQVYVLETGEYYIVMVGSYRDESDWDGIVESISTLTVHDGSTAK